MGIEKAIAVLNVRIRGDRCLELGLEGDRGLNWI
jgi:hypothetical protein